MSRGLPSGRPSQRLPKPFQRKRIEATDRSGPHRNWDWVRPQALEPGDVIAGQGLVIEVTEVVGVPGLDSGLAAQEIAEQTTWVVEIKAGFPVETVRAYPGNELVWAFTRAPGVA